MNQVAITIAAVVVFAGAIVVVWKSIVSLRGKP